MAGQNILPAIHGRQNVISRGGKGKGKPLHTMRLSCMSQEGHCGPVALRIILSHFQIFAREATLARLCCTTRRNGTEHRGLHRAIEQLNGTVLEEREYGTIDHLRHYVHTRRLPVIVGWTSGFGVNADDHYSVVSHVSDCFVWLLDPEGGKRRRISIKRFLRIWHDRDRQLGINYHQWFMVMDMPSARVTA